jgi:hypothetical protein
MIFFSHPERGISMRESLMSLPRRVTFALFLLAIGGASLTASEAIDLQSAPRSHSMREVANIDAEAECFAIDLNVDPVVAVSRKIACIKTGPSGNGTNPVSGSALAAGP